MALAPMPHPRSVYLVLKQAFRGWMAGGTAATIAINAVTGVAASAPLTIAGTVTVNPGTALPASVTVNLMRAGTSRAARTATVTAITGAYTTTFPGASVTASTGYTAVVASVFPAASATSNTFTMT